VKTVLGHIPRVASRTHNPPVQLGLPFHTPECVQSAAIPIPHNVVLQNAIELRWCPPSPGIGLVREAQLVLHVVGNPLGTLQKGDPSASKGRSYPSVGPSASKGRSYPSVRPQSIWDIMGYPGLLKDNRRHNRLSRDIPG